MNLVILAVLGLQAAAVYAPALSGTFLDFQPLSALAWAVTAAAGLVFVAASEAVKLYRRSAGDAPRSSVDRVSADISG